MHGDNDEIGERFAAFVRSHGERHLRLAVLLTGDWHTAERLPRQQRAVLVLRYFEDLPEAEIASLLGCSPGSVKTHAHRGLRTLRELLAERRLDGY